MTNKLVQQGGSNDGQYMFHLDFMALNAINKFPLVSEKNKGILAEQINLCLSFSRSNLPTVMVHKGDYYSLLFALQNQPTMRILNQGGLYLSEGLYSVIS